MEKQNIPTITQMYNIRERNYQWQQFKYPLPKKYTHKGQCFVRSGAIFGNKKSYLDEIQKEKKKVPGPGYYKDGYVEKRPQSGKMDRSQRKTLGQQHKEKTPGPGAYFKRPKSAASTISTTQYRKDKDNKIRDHYLSQVEYLAANTPGIGSYNLTSPKNISGPKLHQRIRPQTASSPSSSHKLLNTTQSYIGTFQWLKKQPKNKNSNYFGKSARFGGKVQKKPAPGQYKIEIGWDSKHNVMNLTHSSSVKSVYYH